MTLLAIAILLSGCAKAAPDQTRDIDLINNMQFEALVHPILRVKVKQSVHNKLWPTSVFSELNDYQAPRWLESRKSEFLPAEIEVVQQLCKFCLGKNYQEVVDAIGIPMFESNQESPLSVFWKPAQPNDKMLLYRFGCTRRYVRLIFRNDRCIEATPYNWLRTTEMAHAFTDHQQEKEPYNPIFHLHPGQKLDWGKLDNSIFLKLNCYNPPMSHGHRDLFYGKADLEAAVRFSVIARGLTRNAVAELAGPPQYQGQQIGCWKFADPESEIWLYRMGGTEIPVRLAFRKNVCREAEVYSDSDQEAYKEWRIRTIKDLSFGKSLHAILKQHGHPDSFTVSKDNAVESITYWPDSNYPTITLYFRLGHCVGNFIDRSQFAY